MRMRSSKGPKRAAALLVASAAAMLAAACGSSNGSGAGTGATAQGGGNGGGMNQALSAYVDCMKQNGVTITLPSRGPGGYNRPSGAARPSGEPRPRPSGSFGEGRGFPGGGGRFFQKPAGVDDATWQKAQQACASSLPSRGAGGFGGGANSAYRNCLQQHGVTMNGGRPASADPKTQQALKTCSVLRQGASPTPSA